MKIILVTSSLTYCPYNYDNVIEGILREAGNHIVGVVVVRISSWSLIKKSVLLYITGCRNVAYTLLDNIRNVSRKNDIFQKHEAQTIYTQSVNTNKVIDWINKKQPDLIFNLRTRCPFQKGILSIPSLGCVNLHHGLLPEQRGLFCDLYALADNRRTGFTLHLMTERIDGGPILSVHEMPSNKNYMQYLNNNVSKEVEITTALIRDVAKTKKLPLSTENNSSTPKTSTPSFWEIKRLQSKGITL